MYSKLFFRAIGLALLFTFFNLSAFAAKPLCKPNDPDYPACLNEPPPPPPPAAIVINSAAVDWPLQQIIIRGEGLDAAVDVSLGGSAPLATTTNLEGTELSIPFDADVANTVTSKGSYQINIDGTDVLSVFIKSQIIDTDASGCPCQATWSAELLGLEPAPVCLEIVGDAPDLAGTIYTNIDDQTVYPHYLFGASFRPSDPELSVCRLVQLNGDATQNELVNERINQAQQIECAAILESTYCSSVVPSPLP